MRGKHHKGKPSDYHYQCETNGCKEYFNTNYKDCNGKCKHCNRKDKNKNKVKND